MASREEFASGQGVPHILSRSHVAYIEELEGKACSSYCLVVMWPTERSLLVGKACSSYCLVVLWPTERNLLEGKVCSSYCLVVVWPTERSLLEGKAHCKKKSVQCTPNMVYYVCPDWNTLYGVKLRQIFGVCFTPNWVCFHTNSVCFPTNFSVFSHSL